MSRAPREAALSTGESASPRVDRAGPWTKTSARCAVLREHAGLIGLLAAFVVLLFFELPGALLTDRDECRYAEIPREMRASGDFVTPTLNGSHYFEKPPLDYWLVAGAFWLCGETPYAARLPARLATLGTVGLLLFEGGALLGGAASCWAALVFLSAPLDFVLGRQNLIDPVLTFFLTWAFLAAYRFLSPEREQNRTRRRRDLLSLGVATGLAMLAKGLVALVLPGLVLLAWIAVMGSWPRVRELLLSPAPLAFLALSAPWFVLVERANPGFSSFFFVHEHFQRFATREAGRTQPFYFFAAVFAVGFLPWTLLLAAPLRALGAPRLANLRAHPAELYLFLWLLVVLLFFSLSQSKLMTYILPAMPAAAALLGRALARGMERPGRPLFSFAALWTVVVIAALVYGLRQSDLARSGFLWPALFAAASSLALAWSALVLRFRSPERRLSTVACCWVPPFLCAALAQPVISARHSCERMLSESVGAEDSVVLYKCFAQSVPWAMGHPVPVVGARDELASDGICPPALFWSEQEFWRRWNSAERVVVLLRASDSADFTRFGSQLPVRLGADDRYLMVSNLTSSTRAPLAAKGT